MLNLYIVSISLNLNIKNYRVLFSLFIVVRQ